MVVGYCRSASHRQGDYQQIDEEKQSIEEFARKHDLLISTIYIDWGVSGVTLDRPQWKRLMEDCKSGQVETVIVSDFNRIARDSWLLKCALDTFAQLGVRVECADENCPISLTMLGAIAEFKKS